ncbi:oxidoreductase [Paenibacillus faecis]|uniref:Gfo/Idh/MocA family protein n=1 Tax=Paenibacillus faecis TaxID=862114 RepID=UPI001B08E60D|nr:Gfo/Idh/MocA family oxidoreductase [Paenibacillus faecis]GIO84225.1 oxidoreductase [Paenibacillus faecis]
MNKRISDYNGEPVTAVIVGAGQRSLIYAGYAERYPRELRIVGVVEPNPERRRLTMERFGIPGENAMASVTELCERPKLADAAINGTMDELHLETTLPLLQHGYDVLLEKPIGVNEEETLRLQDAARRSGRTVMICHVLRYSPFYQAVKERIAAGSIGEIVNIQAAEHVSYHHMAVSFIRGKWNSEEKCKSSMLMQKCCHDLDLIAWLAGGARPVKVGSFGSLMQFRPERAPEGAGTRCLADCPIERDCPYSARKHYIDQDRWGMYVWENNHLGATMSREEKLASLRADNPYGRCVWRCDNDVVDHQSVIIEFDNQATASLNMVGATSRPCRTLHVTGTKGEIQGVLEDGYFVLRHPDPRAGREYAEEKITVDVANDSHGGGDLRLVQDFVRTLRGERPSISSTSLDQSIYGYVIGYAAEQSRKSGKTVDLDVQKPERFYSAQ